MEGVVVVAADNDLDHRLPRGRHNVAAVVVVVA